VYYVKALSLVKSYITCDAGLEPTRYRLVDGVIRFLELEESECVGRYDVLDKSSVTGDGSGRRRRKTLTILRQQKRTPVLAISV
jgi:hypothetical protein